MSADLKNSPAPLAEISQGPNLFEEFLDRNQKNLALVAILLALAAAGFVIYRGIQKSTAQTAGAALSKSEDTASLQAVIDQFPQTPAAGSAMTLLANRQWTDGQQDAAINTLRKFISENAEHPALPSAKASLAAKLMSQGKRDEAAKLFQELTTDVSSRYLAPYALVCLGDLAKAEGDVAKAETFYNQVRTDDSESNFAETANRRIANLKATAPAEIDPPPAPATPPAAGTAPSADDVPAVNFTPGAISPAAELPADGSAAPEPPPADPTPVK